MIILAILLPPLAVFLATHNPVRAGINLLLTLCLWVPGAIHAVMTVNEAKQAKLLRQSEERIIKAQRTAPPR